MKKTVVLAAACAVAVAGCAPTNTKQLIERNNVKTTTVARPYVPVHATIYTSASLCVDSEHETRREVRRRTGATIFALILGGVASAAAVSSQRYRVISSLDEGKRRGTVTFYITGAGSSVYYLHVVAADAGKKQTTITTYSATSRSIDLHHKLVRNWIEDPTACPSTTRKIVRHPNGQLEVVEPPEEKEKNTEPGPPGQSSGLVTSLQ